MLWLWHLPRHLGAARRLQVLAGVPGRHPLEAVLAAAAGDQLDTALALCTGPLPGHDEDQRVLLRAALLTETGQHASARTLLLDHLPVFAHDHWGRAATALLLAELAFSGGQLPDALAWCRVADAELTFTAARSLRLTSDLLRARVCAAQGDAAQAAARLQQARRRVRTPTDDVQWWDAAATIHLAAGDAVGSVMALATVQGATPSALHRARAQARRRQAELAPTTPSPAVPRAPGHVDVILLSGVHLRVDGEERATPRDVLPLLLLTYLMTHDGADLAATADLLLPPARTGRAADERRDAARLRGLIARARHLLGDPGAVLVRAGTLSLGRGYTWAADLNTALATPGLSLGTLPGWLACPWLDDLRESQV